ncbi:MAG TPA: TIGR03943 family protein [Acidimicrobiales bacterium]|nr:TIGR03943 family protein [Acidimicrobiales bacterium]
MTSSPAGGTITLLTGAVLLRLTLTGTYQRYVRVGMGPWLAVAGVVIVTLGLATLVRALRAQGRGAGVPVDGDHDHGEHGDRVGWLLLAPIAALLLVAPPTLGSYGVDRGAAVDITAGAPTFDPLPAADAPAPMTLLEYDQRAFDHDGESFDGRTVQLTGFVADEGTPFRLARYQIACCAVDAAPVLVRVVGTAGATPARDQWVVVTGTFRPGDGAENGEIPDLAATSIVEIDPPEDPYE